MDDPEDELKPEGRVLCEGVNKDVVEDVEDNHDFHRALAVLSLHSWPIDA